MISRITGSPVAHRLLAFALALVGGHSLGQALRVTGSRSLLDFGPLYVGSWMIRDGWAWADLYDPVFFSNAVAHVASAGRIVDLGATPPAVVLLAYPFTGFVADYGKFLFASSGAFVLLLGLFSLGSGRMLGWNRSEWIAFAGILLGSGVAQESVLRGGAATWVFGILAWAVAAHTSGNRWTAAILSGAAANFSPAGWGLVLFSLFRGPTPTRFLSAGVALVGLFIQLLALGPRGATLYAAACAQSWVHPGAFDASWVGRAGRMGALLASRRAEAPGDAEGVGRVGTALSSEVGALIGGCLAAGLVVAVLLMSWVQLRRRRALWSGMETEPLRRINYDPPRLLGIAPSLLAGLFVLGVPEPFRGQGLLLGVPLWASITRLESRPNAGAGLVLLVLALALFLPSPLSARLARETSTNLSVAASVGLALWWWREFRVDSD